jgi:hypothetical protein
MTEEHGDRKYSKMHLKREKCEGRAGPKCLSLLKKYGSETEADKKYP